MSAQRLAYACVHVSVCLCEQEAGAGMGDGVIPKTLHSFGVLQPLMLKNK